MPEKHGPCVPVFSAVTRIPVTGTKNNNEKLNILGLVELLHCIDTYASTKFVNRNDQFVHMNTIIVVMAAQQKLQEKYNFTPKRQTVSSALG